MTVERQKEKTRDLFWYHKAGRLAWVSLWTVLSLGVILVAFSRCGPVSPSIDKKSLNTTTDLRSGVNGQFQTLLVSLDQFTPGSGYDLSTSEVEEIKTNKMVSLNLSFIPVMAVFAISLPREALEELAPFYAEITSSNQNQWELKVGSEVPEEVKMTVLLNLSAVQIL